MNPTELASERDSVLEARNLEKVYHSTTVPVHALRGVQMSVARGDFVSIMGDSGSGKSTLLHVVAGLLSPTNGDVFIEGRSLRQMTDRERTELRRTEIGFVCQRFNLFPALTLVGNLKLAARIYGNGANGHVESDEFRAQVLDELGLSGKEKHKPNELSGGEQQRVAIARAILHRPAIVLADEPTGNLDSENSGKVLRMLVRMNQLWGQTIVMITHSAMAAATANRILRMKDGRIVGEMRGKGEAR